jgi:glucan phosphoethanolaminetransferase (alkaline phosphatase superfamily)
VVADAADPTAAAKAIAMAETRVVRRWKILLLIVLVVSMVAAAISVYFYTSNAEHADFEAQFHNDARKVLESIGEKLALTLGSVDAFVVNIVVCTLYFVCYSIYTQMKMKLTWSVFSNLSVLVCAQSFANSTGQDWPFVTIPNFAVWYVYGTMHSS